MALSTEDCIAAIERHSRGFADATRGNLGASVEHCPGWTVADLVWHLTEVHWFWATIAEERPTSPPDDSRRPSRRPDAELVAQFEEGARRLVGVLAAAEQDAACWTWAPQAQNVAFLTRHQVQEAAVHHWDAVHAAGGTMEVAGPVAADSVEEFLTYSVASEGDPAEPARPPLEGTFALRASDVGQAWTVTDGGAPGTVAFSPGAADGTPAITATASDLLLWLYQRVELHAEGVPEELLRRFRALCFTD